MTQPGTAKPSLARLWGDLLSARSAQRLAREGPQSPTVQGQDARLLLCLEAYAAELSHRRLPIPPVIRDELRLRQRVASLRRNAGR